MKGTKLLLTIIGMQLLALIIIDVIDIVKTQKQSTTISSVCLKEDTNTTICYCSGQL
mgnify:CR=1 FL=1